MGDTSLTVLVVDDDEQVRAAYVEFLAASGYRVFGAAHGGEAILQTHRHRPDVVLLDIGMPVVDGLETAESLRRCPSTAHTRIIAVTARGPGYERARMQAICDDLVEKPCTPTLVESRIRAVLEAAA